jgi:hypothetical protein
MRSASIYSACFTRHQAPGRWVLRFKVMRSTLSIRRIDGGPADGDDGTQRRGVFGIFSMHPDLRDRFTSIVSAVENSEGNLKEADAAEERITEEMRHLGREAMQGWAERQVEVTEEEIRQQPQIHRQGKKTPLAYETGRDRGPSTPEEITTPI